MPHILLHDLGTLLSTLPSWKPAIWERDKKELFLMAVGFEDRSLSCFQQWCTAHRTDSSRAIFVIYPTNEDENGVQQRELQRMATASSIETETISYSTASLFSDLHRRIGALSPDRLVFDISTASSYCIYPLLKACLSADDSTEVRLLYCQAEDYFPSHEEWLRFSSKVAGSTDLLEKARTFDEAHFQSRGVARVYESQLYPGSNIDKTPSKLVLVPNFSHDRIQQMISYAIDSYGVKREETEWILGMPPDQEKNSWRHDAIWELYQQPSPRHAVSTMDPLEMLQALHDIWSQSRFTHSLIIASAGSKPQHVATSLFLEMHPEIALVLSEPQSFVVERYSRGVREIRSMDFGRVGDLKRRLTRWNEIQFVW
jgi:hypothetical protein